MQSTRCAAHTHPHVLREPHSALQQAQALLSRVVGDGAVQLQVQKHRTASDTCSWAAAQIAYQSGGSDEAMMLWQPWHVTCHTPWQQVSCIGSHKPDGAQTGRRKGLCIVGM